MELDELVEKYFKLKNYIESQEAALAERLKPYREGLEKIEVKAQEFLLQNNLQSLRTHHGTVYLRSMQTPTVRDWPEFYTWMMKNNHLELLERRISKENFKVFRNAGGEVPPGVEINGIIKTTFRKDSSHDNG